MSQPDYRTLESLLTSVLLQEVDDTMTLTNTPRQLQRFEARTKRVRSRQRLVAAAAAVAVVGGGTALGVALTRGGSTHKAPPPTSKVKQHVTRSTFGPPTALPANVPVTTLHGPANFGAAAFGSVWATGGGAGHATLYRLSPAGNRILSRTSYPGVNENTSQPTRVGHAIIVADGADNHYTVLNQTGQRTGSLPMASAQSAANAVVGDAQGGWVATSVNTLSRVGASGLHITDRIQLPSNVSIGGVAESPGRLWVLDSTASRLLRVDTATGKVTGQLAFATRIAAHVTEPNPGVVVSYLDGAVYVANQDYGLRRIDPLTLTVTAITSSRPGTSWPILATSTNGQLWAEPSIGVIAQLNPTTLRTTRSIRVFAGNSSGGTFGAVVTGSRIFDSNGRRGIMYSFPVH